MRKLKNKPEIKPEAEVKHEAKEPAVSGVHLLVYKNCEPDKEFVAINGKRIKNLLELAELIAELDHGSFTHHVNSARNDFANWVEHVFSEKALAEKFRRSPSQERHEINVLKHLLGKIMNHHQ